MIPTRLGPGSYHRVMVSFDENGQGQYTVRIRSDNANLSGAVTIVSCPEQAGLLCCLRHIGVTGWIQQRKGSADTPTSVPEWEYFGSTHEETSLLVMSAHPPTFIAAETSAADMRQRLEQLQANCGQELRITHLAGTGS